MVYVPEKDFQTEVCQLSDRCQILDLISHRNNLSWPNPILLKSGRLKYIKIIHRYETNHQLGSWIEKLLIDTNFILLIYYFHQFYDMNAKEFLVLQHFVCSCSECWEIRLSLVTASFWWQWTKFTVRQSWNTRFPTQPTEELIIGKCMT